MWMAGQRANYGCFEEYPENAPSNASNNVNVDTPLGYYNLYQDSASPLSFYNYPHFNNNHNWPAYNYVHPAYVASLWQHYFRSLEDTALAYIYDPYQNSQSYPGYCYWPNTGYSHENLNNFAPNRSSFPRNRHSTESSLHVEPIQEYQNGSQDESASSVPESTPDHTPKTSSTNTSPTCNGNEEDSFLGPMVTVYGTTSIYLRHQIRVDLTVDKAIRLINYATGTVATLSHQGTNICLVHKNGKALLEDETVHLQCKEIMAKITKRGVIFTALKNSLIYIVDASGTKSTAERFRYLDRDISVDLFYSGSMHGPELVEDCYTNLSNHFHRVYDEGDEAWTISDVRIKQSADGEVRITRDFGRFAVRMSPSSGNVSVSNETAHMSASSDDEKLLFVRLGDKRLTSHASGFTARCGTQKAGFDGSGQIILS